MTRRLQVALVLALSAAVALAQPTLRIGACEWPPFTGSGIRGGNGLLAEIAVAALSRAGCKVELSIYPWTRAFDMTRCGENDALLGASYTEERAGYFAYPDPVLSSPIVFWTRARRERNFDGLQSLAPARVGVLNGSNLVNVLAGTKGLTIDLASSVELNVRKLAAGHLDYMVETLVGVQYLLDTSLGELKGSILPLSPPYVLDQIYLVFSKARPDAPRLVADFNAGLRAIKADGTYARILAAYSLGE